MKNMKKFKQVLISELGEDGFRMANARTMTAPDKMVTWYKTEDGYSESIILRNQPESGVSYITELLTERLVAAGFTVYSNFHNTQGKISWGERTVRVLHVENNQ